MNATPVVDQHLIGLCRVSTTEQDTQLQWDALTAAGCGRIFQEKVSTRRADRPGLAAALNHLRPHSGDHLVVWRLDRLGRSVKEVLTIAEDLHARGIGLRILTGTLAGAYTPTGEGKFFFTIMAAFAELERDIIRDRTLAGLEAARRAGRVGGRPTVMDPGTLAAAIARRARGQSPTQIAKALGVSRATLYRHLPPPTPDDSDGSDDADQDRAVTDPPDQTSTTVPVPAAARQDSAPRLQPATTKADSTIPGASAQAATTAATAKEHGLVVPSHPPTGTGPAPAPAPRTRRARTTPSGLPPTGPTPPTTTTAPASGPSTPAPVGRAVDLSDQLDAPVGTWQMVDAGEGTWHLYHDGARVGVIHRESTVRGRRGWLARLDTGAPLPAHGDLAVSGSTLWRTRNLAAAAIARAAQKPRHTTPKSR